VTFGDVVACRGVNHVNSQGLHMHMDAHRSGQDRRHYGSADRAGLWVASGDVPDRPASTRAKEPHAGIAEWYICMYICAVHSRRHHARRPM